MEDKNKKRILITASTFPRYSGDTEPRFVLDLAKELQKYFDVTVLVPAAPDALEKEMLEGVNVERYHYFPFHKYEVLCYPGAIVPRIREKKRRVILVPFLFLGLYMAIKKRIKDYDCVYANWLIPQGVVQSFFSKPYLLTGHGGDVTSLNQGFIRTLKRRAVRNAKAVTVVSKDLKKEVINLFPKKEQEMITKKIVIQPMGCQIERFSVIYKNTDFWKQGEEKVVLFVGRLAEKKGVTYLIEAMKRVKAKLVIVGEGPLRGELQEQVKRQLLGDKVIFMGARSHDELPEIYASADVFVTPSITAKDKDKEGFGLVILEAMASGVPVVASQSGGITEIIVHEHNGLLSKEKDSKSLADNINRLLQDDDLRKKIIINMKKTVEKYDYNAVGERYAELFQQICYLKETES